MSTSAKDLRETLTVHCKNERTRTYAETSYWLSQYKDLARRAVQHAELVTAKLQAQEARAEKAEALYAAPATAPAVPDGDDFNGTTPHLILCMEALVRLDADGVLVPHGIGRDASKLLSAAANRLRKQPAPAVPAGYVAQLAHLAQLADDPCQCHCCRTKRRKARALLQSAGGAP